MLMPPSARAGAAIVLPKPITMAASDAARSLLIIRLLFLDESGIQ
jgi:hypothetical protein